MISNQLIFLRGLPSLSQRQCGAKKKVDEVEIQEKNAELAAAAKKAATELKHEKTAFEDELQKVESKLDKKASCAALLMQPVSDTALGAVRIRCQF